MSASAVFSNLDLVSVLATFLSISDLFRASSVSSTLSTLLANDRIWSPLLSSALALSTVPLPPPTTSPLPALSVPIPPTAVASRLCNSALSAHLHARAAARGHRTSAGFTVAVVAIRRQPGSLLYHVRAALRTLGGAGKSASVARDEVDCREYELEWSAEMRDWRVAAVGEAGSGWSMVNAVDDVVNSSSSSSSGSVFDGKNEAISDAWSDDDSRDSHAYTAAETADRLGSDACKQQYVVAFACSCHPQYRCYHILAPRPPLPAPQPAANAFPGLFSEHHASLLPYPPLAPLPLCSACRTAVAAYVSSALGGGSASRSCVQVRCVVRVNGAEWDVRYLQYERGCVYKRVQLQWSYARLNTGGGWQVVRVYRAHSGAYCNQLAANVE